MQCAEGWWGSLSRRIPHVLPSSLSVLLLFVVLWAEDLCPLPKSSVETLTPRVMVSRGGALGVIKSWGWSPYELGTGRRCQMPSATRKTALPEPHHAGTWILDFQPPEQWEINFCCLQATQSLEIFNSSLNRQRHVVRTFNTNLTCLKILTIWYSVTSSRQYSVVMISQGYTFLYHFFFFFF